LTTLATPAAWAVAAVAAVVAVAGCSATGHAPAPAHPRATRVARARCLVGAARSLSVCPQSGAAARLPSASFPYLGIRCRIANWTGCDRIGVGVHLARPATLVAVSVDGHLVTLSPPTDPGSDLWQGMLLGVGPRHGPLAVRASHGYWYGEPPVRPRIRVTVYFADGTTATRAGVGYLHPGYG
jgi:hypothetical protein